MERSAQNEKRVSALWPVVVLALSCGMAPAQTVQVGGRVMGGAIAVSSGGASAGAPVGIEVCVGCRRRFALFGEYGHWFSSERAGLTDRVRSADLGGAGLRIQWLRKVPVFLDVGFVGGRDQHATGGGGAMGGIVVGTGVHFRLAKLWYVRPQFRMYGLSPHSVEGMGLHWAALAGAGVGASF
jgi:hypothetical protein